MCYKINEAFYATQLIDSVSGNRKADDKALKMLRVRCEMSSLAWCVWIFGPHCSSVSGRLWNL